MALRWFYERLALTDGDRELLRTKRGLHDRMIDWMGYRSNLQSNKELLLAMADAFSPEVLVDSGLWKLNEAKPSEPPKPNAQYYGMSVREKRDERGKKVRDQDGESQKECVWDHPILIPYFNEDGELVHLRPHKGMMAGKTPHFYVARPGKSHLGAFKLAYSVVQLAAITEGEFKAAAMLQGAGDGLAAGALPGITMAKTLAGDVEDWLETTGARKVAVAYDNEDKGNPALPGYQEDKWRRYDAQVWARFLARQLAKQGYDTRVAHLPDAWRDKLGKADWDGRLAAVLADGHHRQQPPSNENRAAEWTGIWSKVEARVRAEFWKVLEAARAVGELWQAGFFDSEEERIIKNALEKISYEPCLPIGGDDEQVQARRLQKLAMKLKASKWFPERMAGFVFMLAQAWNATQGRYFIMRPLTEKQQGEWSRTLELARSKDDDDAKRVCELVLRGKKSMGQVGHIPKVVTDFYMKAHYVLHRMNGTRERMVTLHNVHGVNTGLVSLPSEAFGSPVKLRDWLHNNITGASLNCGQNELSALHEDTAHEVAFKDVMEVPLRGYHKKSKIWFFEDVAFSDDGREFLPDKKTGIFWIKLNDGEMTQGYTFARDGDGRARDRENDVFRQGVPTMQPSKKSSAADVRELFADVCTKLPEALGGMEAYMALGIVLAAAAGPEIFAEWSAFPGLWVHGEQGEGKSALVRWLIRLWGFNEKEKGLPLPADDQRTTLTLAALSGALGQYGELPLWLDEYQTGTASWVRAILKNSYDRMEGAKKDFGSSPREFLASVIVSGVATSSEPQTRSRFAHVQVTSKNRKANHYQWFQVNSREFYRIGRHILRNRKLFVENALAGMRTWVQSKEVADVDDRARMVHGLAFAGFHASCALFDQAVPGDWRRWLVEHCRASALEVQESVAVDLFWREVLNALESEAFGQTPADRRRIFHVAEDPTGVVPMTEHQRMAAGEMGFKDFKPLLLYFQPGPVIEMLRASKRRSGSDIPIQKSDLRNQMESRPYWHPGRGKDGHRQRFGGGAGRSCWCIRVWKHELGYIPITDEEFEESFVKEREEGYQPKLFNSEDWVDPRKGDLYALIESLAKQED